MASRPQQLPAVAARAGVHGVMLDTARQGRHVDVRGPGRRRRSRPFSPRRAALGLMTALAGALGAKTWRWCARLGVDIVGVRGALATEGARAASARERVRALREALGLSAAASRALARP